MTSADGIQSRQAITKYAGPVIDNSLEGAYNLKEAVKADLPEAITKRRVSMDVFRSEEEKKEPAKPKKPFISRLIQAGEVVLTSIEAAGQDLINTSTDASSSVAGSVPSYSSGLQILIPAHPAATNSAPKPHRPPSSWAAACATSHSSTST